MFFPKTVYKVKSDLSGTILVTKKGPELRLIVGGYTQSVNLKAPKINERVWGQMAGVVAGLEISVGNCLILGLGGGTVAQLLVRKFPGLQITGVEVDPKIVKIAQKYFDLGAIPHLTVIEADAGEVVSKPQDFGLAAAKFELIIVDTYNGGQFPLRLERDEFLTGLKTLLAKGGVIVFNRIADRSHRADLLAFEGKLKKHFAKIETKAVPGLTGSDNLLLVCS